MDSATLVQLENDGWWASYKVGEDNILGHGSTREAALEDLKRQVDAFVKFLKRTGRAVPEELR
jgi:hypothetical protein